MNHEESELKARLKIELEIEANAKLSKIQPLSLLALFLFSVAIFSCIVTYIVRPEGLLKMQSIAIGMISLSWIIKNLEYQILHNLTTKIMSVFKVL